MERVDALQAAALRLVTEAQRLQRNIDSLTAQQRALLSVCTQLSEWATRAHALAADETRHTGGTVSAARIEAASIEHSSRSSADAGARALAAAVIGSE
jgi:hypothetical protein